MQKDKDLIFKEYPTLIPEENTVQDLVNVAHDIAFKKGWWESDNKPFPEFMSLLHSELDEAYDFLKTSFNTGEDSMDDHLTEQPGFIVELADTAIRIMDYLGFHKINIDQTINDLFLSGVPGKEKAKVSNDEIRIEDLCNKFVIDKMAREQSWVFLLECHKMVSDCLEINRSSIDPTDMMVSINFKLVRLLINIFVFSQNNFGENVLESILIQKMNYNLHRGYRHGKNY